MKTVIVNAHVISPGVDLPCAAVEIAGGRIVKSRTKREQRQHTATRRHCHL